MGIVKKIVEMKNKEVFPDTVFFMSAYIIHEHKRNRFKFLKKKKSFRDVLQTFHINGVDFNNRYITSNNHFSYSTSFDPIMMASTIHFDDIHSNEIEELPENEVNNMMYTLSFRRCIDGMLDRDRMNVFLSFDLENFLVTFESRVFEVAPVAFMLNESIIISYELIDFDKEISLKHDDIYGRYNNYAIQSIETIKYSNDTEFKDENRCISEIIFKNICGFLNEASGFKCDDEKFSYVHNLLVISNNVNKVDDYFQKVLGARIDNMHFNNLVTHDGYEYYLKEFLGLVTNIKKGSLLEVIIEAQVFESFKMYLLLRQTVDYDIKHDLDELINSRISFRQLLFPSYVPIVTMNLISELKSTITFTKNENAVIFKIDSLKTIQDRKRNSNAVILNALLFALALISSLQSLDILEKHFGISFTWGLIIICGVFVIGGLVWYFREPKK